MEAISRSLGKAKEEKGASKARKGSRRAEARRRKPKGAQVRHPKRLSEESTEAERMKAD